LSLQLLLICFLSFGNGLSSGFMINIFIFYIKNSF
jgi:hypothetical protein